MEVSQLGRLGASWIDDDHRPRRVLRNLLQRDAGVREPVRLPRVLPHEERHFAVLKIGTYHRAEHPAVDPKFAGLLLAQRVRAELRAERPQRRAAIRPTEMIALSAAAVVKDRLAAVHVFQVNELRRHFADRRVPVDLLERTVSALTKWRRQPSTAVLVVVEAQRLLARVALGAGVVLVATDALKARTDPAFGDRAEANLDTAVALAEDAGGLLPRQRFGFGHRCLLGKSVQ